MLHTKKLKSCWKHGLVASVWAENSCTYRSRWGEFESDVRLLWILDFRPFSISKLDVDVLRALAVKAKSDPLLGAKEYSRGIRRAPKDVQKSNGWSEDGLKRVRGCRPGGMRRAGWEGGEPSSLRSGVLACTLWGGRGLPEAQIFKSVFLPWHVLVFTGFAGIPLTAGNRA